MIKKISGGASKFMTKPKIFLIKVRGCLEYTNPNKSKRRYDTSSFEFWYLEYINQKLLKDDKMKSSAPLTLLGGPPCILTKRDN